MFAAERTANIKDNRSQMQEKRRRDGTKIACDTIAKGHIFLTFWPLSSKLKENFHCDLCDSSDVSGRSSKSED